MRKIRSFVALGLVACCFIGCGKKTDDTKGDYDKPAEPSVATETEASMEAENTDSNEIAVIEGFGDYVTSIDNLEIPEGTRIVALGEASHGNSEFQQLKTEVFKVLAEKYDIRTLVIEGDFGGCTLVNDYILGGEGDAEELTKHLGYRLYRTDDMMGLITWMHEYNESAPDDKKVRLYGMDVQKSMDNIQVLKDFYSKVDETKAKEVSDNLDLLFGTEEDGYDKEKIDEIIEYTDSLVTDISDNAEDYIAATDQDQQFRAMLAAESLNYYIILLEKEGGSNKYRDCAMKVIVDQVLEYEEKNHSTEIMMSCHNGHMTKNNSSPATFLGTDLYDEYESAYFAIGTDFYISNCNLPDKDGRIVVEFIGDDPLAFSMKDSDLDKGLLTFSDVEEGTPLYEVLNSKISTGSIGEYYQAGMNAIKPMYEIRYAPVDMYDAMILYYEVNPTEIWE